MIERNVIVKATVYPVQEHRTFVCKEIGTATTCKESIEFSVGAYRAEPLIRFEDGTVVQFSWEELVRAAIDARANLPHQSDSQKDEGPPAA